MDTAVSENSFRRGLEAVQRRAFLEALAYFEAALKLAKRQGSEAVPMKYLSYYGLCVAVCSSRLDEARRICEAAGGGDSTTPDRNGTRGRGSLRPGNALRASGSSWAGF